MTKNNRYTYSISNGFLLIPLLFTLVFSYGSVVKPPLPPKNPTAFAPQQAVGTTDSLKIAKKLFQNDKPKEALQISLKILKKSIKVNDSISIEKASFLIAQIFSKSNNYEKALEYLAITLRLATQTQQPIEYVMGVELNMSKLFYQNNQTDSAVFYLNRIIDTKNDTQSVLSLKAKAYSNLSGLLSEQGDLIHAEIHAYNALEIHEKNTNKLSTAFALNSLGTVFLKQNRFRDAKRVFYEAIALIPESNSGRTLNLQDVLYDNLSWALYNLKDYRTYEYQEKSFAIRDSLRNAEISGILAEIEGKYNKETIKKQEQLKTAEERRKVEHTQSINNILIIISLSLLIAAWLIYRYLKLRQKNLQLQFQQEQLIQDNKLEFIQNETREKILNATLDGKESERKMIAETLHHSVSSLLSSASLHLQASKMQLKETPPEEIIKAQKIIIEAADKIRNLSHSLVSSVLLKFGLAYAIQDLCDKYSNSSLQFHCDCIGIKRYAQDFELKINSIIDELLNNIIKHSKASNAEIKLKKKDDFLEITILDDGTGFNPNEYSEKSGLGLRQIETRINKMEGVFKINSSINEGTTIYISVPMKFVEKNAMLN